MRGNGLATGLTAKRLREMYSGWYGSGYLTLRLVRFLQEKVRILLFENYVPIKNENNIK